MPRYAELIGYQLTLPNDLGDMELVPRYSSAEKIEPYFALSQSRVELAAGVLGHPDELVPDPKQMALPVHLAVTAGTIVHHIAQRTGLWRAIQPTDTHGYEEKYRHNLFTLLPHLTPSSSPRQLRQIIAALDDPRLALPKSGDREVSAGARETIYNIIAANTLEEAKTQPPFTGTEPLFDPDEGLIFPRPEVFAGAWEDKGRDDAISKITEAIFEHDESQTVLPGDYGRNTKHLGAASELRMSGLDHDDRLVWSGRLDSVTRTKEYQGKTIIMITDFKSNQGQGPETAIEDDAIRSAAFMTAQLAINLPEMINCGTVKINLRPRPIPRHVELKLTHLIFGGASPGEVDILAEIGEDWHSPKEAHRARERFGDLVQTIRANEEKLKPILKR